MFFRIHIFLLFFYVDCFRFNQKINNINRRLFTSSLFKNFGNKENKENTENSLISVSEYDIENNKEERKNKFMDGCKDKFYNFGLFPRLECANYKGQLTWYPIGFASDFGKNPKRVTIRDINYIVWKDSTKYYALRDCCSHQGSSFMLGETLKNTITCPYHGYIFDGDNGELIAIPQLPHMNSCSQNINSYKIVEKGDMVYLNTVVATSEAVRNEIDESYIFTEPEYFMPGQRPVLLSEDFEHYAKFVSVNSLDICHIGFVHTFGNRKRPNPLKNSKVLKINDNEHHYKIIYEYVAGENSLVNKIYNFENITVENEYVLPHTTVARVKFGEFSSTIITHALPVSTFKTKLFVKAYRNYWAHNLSEEGEYPLLKPLLYPFQQLINIFGDKITYQTMYTTLKQDKGIVDYIDKTDYVSMHGRFSIVYDMFSSHYKNNYKRFYEQDDFIL